MDVADPNAATAAGLGVSDDFENHPRPSDQGYDMGADEYAVCLAKIVRTGIIYGHIQEAIDASLLGDAIQVHGTCTPQPGDAQVVEITVDSLSLSGGWDEEFSGQSETTPTRLDGLSTGRVILLDNDAFNATFSTFTLQNGSATNGGLVYNAGTLSLSTVNMSNGQATNGGGIYNDDGGSITMVTVEIISTTATQNGGAIHNVNNATLDMQDIDILTAIADQNGGGIYNMGTIARLNNLDESNGNLIAFAQAVNGDGGGIYNNSDIDQMFGTFVFSSSAGSEGGGMYNGSSGVVDQLQTSDFDESFAPIAGGGLYNSGTIDYSQSTYFTENTSALGAGLYSSGSIYIQNAYFFSNTATNDGGGIYIDQTGSSRFVHNTIRKNVANNRGGGMFVANGSVVMTNSLIVENQAPGGGGGIHGSGGTVVVDYSNYWNNTPDNSTGVTNQSNNIGPVNPKFSSETFFALDPSSPVIDRGDSGVSVDCCIHPDYPQPPIRPQNNGFDLGAWEEWVRYEVLFTPDDGETLAPGSVITYVHSVNNIGNITDTYTISVQDPGMNWYTNLTPTEITLGPGDSYLTVLLTVQVPEDALSGEQDTVVLLAQSQTVTTTQDTVLDETTVDTIYRWEIAPDNRGQALPGTSLAYSHLVTNTGNITDTARFKIFINDDYASVPEISVLAQGTEITKNPQSGTYSTEPLTVTLAPGESTWVTNTVEFVDWVAGDIEVLNNVIVRSEGNLDFQTAAANTTIISFTTGTRYVDPEGNDQSSDDEDITVNDNNCTTTSNPGPCKTIAHALSQAMPGDTIALLGNVTFTELTTATVGTDQVNQVIYLDKGVTIQGGYDTNWNRIDPFEYPTVLQVPVGGRGIYITGTIEAAIAGVTISGANPSYTDSNGGAIYNDGANLTVNANILHDNQAAEGSAIYNTSTGVITIQNNFIYSNTQSPAIYVADGQARIENNSFFDNDPTGAPDTGAAIEIQAGDLWSSNNIFADSVVDETSAVLVAGTANATITTNIYDGYTTPVSGDTDAASLIVDPEFINPASGNLHIGATSPALEAGLLLSTVTTDIDGNVRPIAATHDIGADEREFEAGLEFTPDYISSTNNINHIFTYTHFITNTGQVTDTFTLSHSSSAGWDVMIVPQMITLSGALTGTQQSGVITVSIAVTGASQGGVTDITRITATSRVSATLSEMVTNTSSVVQSFGLTFTPDQTKTTMADSIIYTHTLTNNGNGTDTFTFITATDPANWTVQPITPIQLSANTTATVEVVILIPVDSGGITNTTTITAVSSGAQTAAVVDTTYVDFERGVAIDPDRSGSALPGDVITYTHTLTNTGNASDSFTITRSSNVPTGWTVDFTPQTIASLPGGSSVPVTVTVTVPNTASLAISGTTHVLTLTATSAADPGGSTDIAVDTTTIGLDVQLILEALDPVSQALTVETVVTYTHRITNAGNLTDTVSFTVSNSLAGFGWSTEPTPIPTLILAPDESQTFVITLTVPVPPGGAANITTITATSSFSAGLIYDTSVNTTTVTPVYSVSLVQDEIALVVADAVTATFVHTVTNLGNVQESFALDSFSSLPGWGVTISPTLVTLNPAVSQTISVLVTIPTNSGGLTNTVQITATSVTDTSASATVTETIIVPIDLGVLIEPDRVLAGQPGVTLSYTHTVTNLGNVTDSFTFTIVGTSLPGWVITPSPSRVENLPGSSSQIVTVTVQIPLTPSLALSGTVQVFTPTIVSDADPVTIRDTVVDTTTIGLTPSVIIEGLAPITRTLMGENLVTYTHVITNQGNFTDSIDLTLSNSLAAFGWTFEPDPLPTLLLGPNQSSSLVITLTVPPPGGSNINVTVITATSSYTNMGLVYDTSTNTTTVTSVYSVSLVKPEALVVAPDAITTTIVHTITNLGNVPDTYSITVQSANPAWVITPDPSTITLAASLSDTITLTVQIPASSGGTSNIFTTTATSQNDDTPPNAFATVTDTVTVPLTRGVQIEPDLTLSGQPGQVLTFSHILTNTGNSVDSFTLAILPDSLPGWQVTIVPTNVASLAGSDSVPVTVVVEIPVTNTQALSGTAHTTLITATSVASPATVIDTATDTSIVTALANIIFEADISITTDQTLVTHTHTITNQGNTTDTLTMAYASSLGWAQTLVPSPTVQLAPSQSAAVTLTLVVPIGSGGLTDITVISATSTVNPAISASVVDSTTISQTAGVRFTPDRIGIADPDTVVYTHTLENLGNGPDVFTFTASHSVPGWTIDLVEPVALLSAETTTVVITATVPPNSGNLVNTSIITAVSNADITITDSVTETTTVPQVLGVIIEPEQTLSGVPGQVLTFSHTLTNSGNVTDSVSLIASSVRGWDVTISPTLTTILNGGASTLVEVTVTLPLTGLDSYSGTVDTIVVTATSILSPTITDTTTDTVTIEAVPAVQIEPDYSVNAFAGNIISFTHTVTNAGNLTDTISINSANSAGWDVTTLMPITLFPGQSTTIIISVTVDAVTATEINTTTVTVTSGFDGSVSDQAIDVITASPSSAGVGLEPDNASTANSGSIISYQHVLTNLGDTDDTFTFEAASSQGWIINPVNGITLSPNQTRTVTIQIIIPINSGGLVDTTVVTATSSRDTTVFATAINTTTVNQMHDLAWHLLSATNPVSTSTNIAYTYVITNSGDGVETLDITAFSDLGWSFILPGTLSIPAGDQQTVVLTVIVPTGSGGLTSAIAFTTTSTISPSNVLSDDHQISIPLARSLRFIADQSSFALPGDTLMYTHFLTNTGNSTDTFNLTFTQNLPWGSVSPNVVTLNAGEQTTVQVSVSVPNNLAGETVHTIVVTASSNLSPTLAVDTVTDVTTYREVSIYLPVVMKNASADTSTPTPTPTPTVTPTATPAPVSGVDLVVTDLTLIPSSPISGQQVTVQVTIRNQGNVNVSFGNNFFVDFYVNLTDPDPTFAGDIFWSVQGVELSAGASKTLTGQYTFADGVYTLHSKVDTQDDVKNEVNESNNLFGPTILNVGNVTAREEGDPVPVPEPTKAVTPRATVTPQP
ncbi:MAG: NEW3 domain-containing protein [Chloroflexota bacterium]